MSRMVYPPFSGFPVLALLTAVMMLPFTEQAGARPLHLHGELDKTLFNDDWRFAASAQPGSEWDEAHLTSFDDTKWRTLRLPHDWAVDGPFEMRLDGATGKLPWRQVGWYRKRFTMPAEDTGKRIYLDLDGAMANSTIYLNGKEIGGRPYGYMSFRTDLTDAIQFGTENTLAIRLNTVRWGSRWYPGAGLYRNAWLVKTSPVHVGQWGVHIQTPTLNEEQGTVTLDVTLENHQEDTAGVKVQSFIFEYGADATRGAAVAESTVFNVALAPHSQQVVGLKAQVQQPKRWDTEDPQRYLAVTEVYIDDTCVDRFLQPFGFRTLEFTARDGFRLNGRRVPIQGVCMHHDLGPLGAAFHPRAFERQMEIMKEMGVNALRTSHNPPAPEVLEICDRMGILVQVETFDCWRKGKKPYDYGDLFDDWHERDLRDIILMARNHPSVFMWCLGNEVNELKNPEDSTLVERLNTIAKRYDPHRPTTVGSNSPKPAFTDFGRHVDVFGFNYHPKTYQRFVQATEEEGGRPFHASETASTVSSRGEYFFPVFDDFQSVPSGGTPGKKPRRPGIDPSEEVSNGTGGNFHMSSYDVGAPGWASTPDYQFMRMDKTPEVHGEFVWTGFDYLGEPTPYNRDLTNLLNFSDPEERAEMQQLLDEVGRIKPPSRSSYFGIVDLCGFKKDRFYLYQSRWRPEWPMAHILPHWNWPERVGQVTPVHVYTSGDEAELFLNGQSLGRKKKQPYEYRLRWNDVVYEPGELKVVAYREGRLWAEDLMITTEAATQLDLAVDRSRIQADGVDLAFITVRVLDAEQRLVPRTHHPVHYTLEGPGEIVGVGNGDPTSLAPFKADEGRVFNGMALVIVRSQKGTAGPIRLHARSEGLTAAVIDLESANR